MFGTSEFFVELDAIQGHELVYIEGSYDDLSDLLGHHAIGHRSSSAANEGWIKTVNVEADVDGAVQLLDVINHAGHVQVADVLLADSLFLEIIDVANANVGQLVELEFAEAHAGGPMLLLHAAADRKGCSMGVARRSRGVSVDVGVRIDPNDVEVLKLLQTGEHGRTGDRVVAS